MPRGYAARDNTYRFLTRRYEVTSIELVGDNAVITGTSTARTTGTTFPAGASTFSVTVRRSQLSKLPQVGSIVDANLNLTVVR